MRIFRLTCNLFTTLLIFFSTVNLTASDFPNTYKRQVFSFHGAASFNNGLLGFSNPANLRFVRTLESKFFWQNNINDTSLPTNWGSFTAIPGLGFGVQQLHFGNTELREYRLGTGFGSEAFAIGFGYAWTSQNSNKFQFEKMINSGAIFRPSSQISIGLEGRFSVESSAYESVGELGIRPFGDGRLTLFADGSVLRENSESEFNWGAGVVVQPLKGINIIGRYYQEKMFNLGIQLSLGKLGFGTHQSFNEKNEHLLSTYMIESGPYQQNLFNQISSDKSRFVDFQLKGKVDYHKYKFFDHSTVRFMELLSDIQLAANNPKIETLVFNFVGLRVRPEHAWELREGLLAAKKSGKKIIIFIERVMMTGYHLASCADHLVLDPEGALLLPGYSMGRTFLKGTLEKLGLGFDEWRFFKYKSAAENFSREEFSVADREQRQAYIDDWYELVQADVSTSRQFSKAKFDSLIDHSILFSAKDAIAEGLVDTLARWSDMHKIISHYSHKRLNKISRRKLREESAPEIRWGKQDKIALVYGLGECAMDYGIRARWLEKVFLKLANMNDVKAVVFRVDSPGGDGMASELVASALKKCKINKPVIISQGQVAGSGGYWISMDGTKILAGPNTVTGSIGVIGGWVYDKGISDKLGMTADLVKRGKHADVGFGVRLPLIGLKVPARNLSGEERQLVENYIRQHYRVFLQRVAEGRNLSIETVEQIAEGHFYSGLDGKENGLIDEIGGLTAAIDIAKMEAGIKLDDAVKIVEIPKYKGAFRLPSLPYPFSVKKENDAVFNYIKHISENPGEPYYMLPPGSYPEMEK